MIHRREFLKESVRGAALLALGLLTGKTVFSKEDCPEGACGPCPRLGDCDQPPAQALRAEKRGWRRARLFAPLGKEGRRIAVAPDGKILAACDHSVFTLEETGERVRSFDFGMPVWSVTPHGGLLYVSLGSEIRIYTAAWEPRATWKVEGRRPWVTGLAVQENEVIAADAGGRALLRYDRSGRRLGRIDDFVVPSPYFNVRAHPDGRLLVNNPGRHRMEAYDAQGELEAAWGEAGAAMARFGGCCNPCNFALLPDGRFVTCEKGTPRAKVYSSKGEFEALIAGPEAFPNNKGSGRERMAGLDAAVDRKGRVYLLDLATTEIHCMEPLA